MIYSPLDLAALVVLGAVAVWVAQRGGVIRGRLGWILMAAAMVSVMVAASSPPTVAVDVALLASLFLAAAMVVFAITSHDSRLEMRLLQSEKRFRNLFENAIDPIFIIDEEGRYVDVNRKASEIFGFSRAEFLTRRVLDLMPPEQWPRSAAAFRQLRQHGEYEKFSGSMRCKDGSWRHIEVSSSLIREGERVVGSLAMVRDVTDRVVAEQELRRLNRQLEQQATHDALTRLPNRALLLDRLQHALDRAARFQSRIGVLFIDLDGFKAINDRYGHRFGDEVLQAQAQRIRERVRQCDTAARLGGDEFAVVLEQLPSPDDALQVAGMLAAGLAEPLPLSSGAVVRLGASIGISLFPDHGVTSEVLLNGADQAMYRVKSRGRGGCELFSGAHGAQSPTPCGDWSLAAVAAPPAESSP